MSAFMPTNDLIFLDKRFHTRRVLRRWAAWSALGILVLLKVAQLFGACATRGEAHSLSALPARTAGERAQLAVRSVTVERRHGFLTLTGEAANLSQRSLNRVEAVLELFDSQGKLLGVESALLELPTVRPGEESPFRVQMADSPEAAAYRIRFRHLLGATIPSRM